MDKKCRGWMLLILMTLLLTGCATQAVETAAAPAKGAAEAALTIREDTLSGEPVFIDWNQAGTSMQLIALRDAGGHVRVALNTCQSCNGSPYAYFEYIGSDTLQCQNCGLTFSTATVGSPRAAGCNPFPITNFSEESGVITVPEAVLKQAAPLFANWKVFE